MAKLTTMVIKVDPTCCNWYKKVKKLLCKIPQIQNQVYDEEKHTVTITVACCCPEKIMEKIRCKGCKLIISVEIKQPPQPEPRKEPIKYVIEHKIADPVRLEVSCRGRMEPGKKKDADKAKEKEEAEKRADPKPTKEKVVIVEPPKQKPQPPIQAPERAPGCPPVYPNYPLGVCCTECYGARGGGPCQQLGYGRPIWYDGYCGKPVYDSWGGGGGGHFCEENPSTCSVM